MLVGSASGYGVAVGTWVGLVKFRGWFFFRIVFLSWGLWVGD